MIDCNAELALRSHEMDEAQDAELASKTAHAGCEKASALATSTLDILEETVRNKKLFLTKETALRENQKAAFDRE